MGDLIKWVRQEALSYALGEAALLNTLPAHPGIVRFFGSLQRERKRARGGGAAAEGAEVLLLTEFCAGGALSAALSEARDKGQALHVRGLLVIFHQVVCAVDHLHCQAPPIAHRDLKMENVLLCGGLGPCLAASARVLLCDFGSATTRAKVYEARKDIVEEEERIQAQTTVAYRAPEMVDLYQKKRIDDKVDLWALGVLLFAMLFGRFPFDPQFPLGILSGAFAFPAPERGEDSDERVARQVISACLQVDPAARPSARKVLQMLDVLELPQVQGAREGWGDEAV